ncbi:hypothetical protein GCM10008916_12770 [Clostridium nitritogenes]|uniref:YolD-like protein n=1 Tax=Clostridium nitritogenes TaxID=83340 RepID=A0ABP3X1H7_9CLOT
MIKNEFIIEKFKNKINETKDPNELVELASMLKRIQMKAIEKIEKYKEQEQHKVICLVGTWRGIHGIIESIDGETIVIRLGSGLRIITSKKHFKYNFKFV